MPIIAHYNGKSLKDFLAAVKAVTPNARLVVTDGVMSVHETDRFKHLMVAGNLQPVSLFEPDGATVSPVGSHTAFVAVADLHKRLSQGFDLKAPIGYGYGAEAIYVKQGAVTRTVPMGEEKNWVPPHKGPSEIDPAGAAAVIDVAAAAAFMKAAKETSDLITLEAVNGTGAMRATGARGTDTVSFPLTEGSQAATSRYSHAYLASVILSATPYKAGERLLEWADEGPLRLRLRHSRTTLEFFLAPRVTA